MVFNYLCSFLFLFLIQIIREEVDKRFCFVCVVLLALLVYIVGIKKGFGIHVIGIQN